MPDDGFFPAQTVPDLDESFQIWPDPSGKHLIC